MAAVNSGSVRLGASCVERTLKDVRGISSSLPERISSGRFSSSSGKGKVCVAKRSNYSCVSDFVISNKIGYSTRCSSVPSDAAAAGTSKNLGTDLMNLRWTEEDVVVSGVENSARNVSVVQAFSEDAEGGSNGESEMTAELLDSDRPHPIVGAGFDSNPLSILEGALENALGGNDTPTITAAMYRPKLLWFTTSEAEENRFIDISVNALLAGAAISYAFAKIVTVDQDVWHGWTTIEVLKYAPLHNWLAYEEVLKSNPVLAKMMISGIVYSIGDWIGQCVEGKAVLEFSRVRLLRSGLVGFCLHGSLSHHYYYICEFLFPFKGWWVVPLKVLFDQTIWSAIWNSIYFITLGLLRFESPMRIYKDLKSTFVPLLTAGWKLWPFAHLITYGLVPLEQRLLWVDCVEILWVTILSVFANEKSQQRLEIIDGEEAEVVVSKDVGKEMSANDLER